MCGALRVGTVVRLLPGGSRLAPSVLALARWFADLERWRIAKVRSLAGRPDDPSQWRRPKGPAARPDPGLWLDVAHALVAFPVALVTFVVTALWWWIGVAGATDELRSHPAVVGPLRPQTLYLGSAQTHIALSLGLTSPAERLAVGTAAGLLLRCSLPLGDSGVHRR